MKLTHTLASQRSWLVLVETAGLTMLIGFADYFSSWELSLFIFYGIPVFVAAWYCDRRAGFAIAALGAVTWYAANLPTHPYKTQEGYLWAGANRLFYFVFVAVGAAAIRSRIGALTLARSLEQEIVRASEREQIRIGQDLHDGVCQNLAAIDCATETLKDELDAIAPHQAATAGMIQKLLKQTMIEARNLARGVFPIQIETDGLASTIRDFVSQKNALSAGTISFVSCGDIQVDDTQIALHLYRIAQEAVSNAIRHSGAGSILIVLSQEGPCLELTISDDGRGFETADNDLTGIGLRTMRYRAQLIGAAIAITNRPGSGAMVRCTMRLPTGTVVPHANPR